MSRRVQISASAPSSDDNPTSTASRVATELWFGISLVSFGFDSKAKSA
jgi:hypothetical protein